MNKEQAEEKLALYISIVFGITVFIILCMAIL